MNLNYSVVIPAYNASETLAETLDSVLGQSITPAEVIVIDDGSTDETARMVSSYPAPVRLVSQSNHGCGHATSTGIELSEHPIIAGLDADDIWLPHKMQRQLDYLATHPETSIVCSQWRLFQHNNPDRENGPVKDGYGRSTLVIRREVYEQIGKIVDPPGNRGELIDWLARCRDAGLSIDLIPEVLSLRRIIAGSLSYGRNQELDRGYLDVARRAILRKKLKQQEADCANK